MDGWANSSGRMTLLWPHTAACLSVTLYLPASSAKILLEGWGEREIHNKSDYQEKKKNNVWEERNKQDQAFTRIPDQVSLFSISS